jgi:SsrA-binding protein
MSNKKSATPPKETERDTNAKKIIAVNRRARHEFEILENYHAGMALVGTEVKSVRAGRVNFADSFCRIEGNEMWLYSMHIMPHEQGNRWNVEPLRKRKLLLHKWEIIELREKTEQKGLTIVPLAIYMQRGFAKMEIGLARGKKLYDKRESIAERDREREQQRELSSRG